MALLVTDSSTRDFFERKTVSDYDSFVNVLNKDLKKIIRDLQHDRHQFQSEAFGEDAISSVIIKCLKTLNYDAEHDTQHGGHCDILVKHQTLGFEWIGEAKLWKGQKYIADGLEQLLTRYATAVEGENCGGLLVYVKQPQAVEKMKTWRDTLAAHPSTVSLDSLDGNITSLEFNSVQKAEATGLDYRLKNYFVSLYHASGSTPEYDENGNEITLSA
ncbi:hypothetical protein GOU96_06145 [Vibrio sp. R-1]|uniref:hypothetical protein n=1 Tax=Vibrio TaxID=662 RepID=UPI0011410C10|nr:MULTISPECIES: hypothetical protein [Vibrio]MCX9456695.1 hypothetical protein [Vibrio cholerae]MEB3776157.1 hypothetical protein [Vibrio sp. R-1]